jgi:hypothetical protein
MATQKIQTIRLNGGRGIEVTFDMNDKRKCKCGKTMWFALTKNKKWIPIVMTSLAVWNTHFADCPLANKFRKPKQKDERQTN